MNWLKICRIIFIAIILCSMPLVAVRAQTEQTSEPAVAFVDSTPEIRYYIGDIEQMGFSVSVVNRSDNPVTLYVLILGVDNILQSDIGALQPTLKSGEVTEVSFTLKTGNAVAEIISKREALTGYLIFSSSAGGFVYKTISITTEPSPAEIKGPKASEIILPNESDGTITFDWNALENRTMVFPVLNTSKYSANIEALLYFPDLTSNQPPVIQPIRFLGVLSLPIEPFKASNIRFKLNDPSSEPKKYDGLLILTDAGGAWSILKKVELYIPSAGQQPAPGTGLGFLADDKTPISLDYNCLKRGEPVEIGLINQGKVAITISSARVIITDLIDQKGKKIELQSLDFQPLTIPPLETGFIDLRLYNSAPAAAAGTPASTVATIKITGTPQSGTYGGYLVLATDSDQPVLVKPVSLEVSTISSALPTALDKIAAGIQILFQNRFHRQFRFGAADWSILAIIVVLVLAGLLWACQRVWFWLWNASGKLGPILIEEIPGKPELRASLRQHLAHCGVPSTTAVPNASIGVSEFTTVIAKSKIPEAAFLEAILLFFQKLLSKRTGYVVTALVSEGASKTSVNVQIRLAYNNKVKYIRTLEGNDPEEAIKNAAYYIFYRICSQKAALARVPKWSRFPTFASYQQYRRAEELKGEEKYSEAIEQYKCASKEAPFNALLRLGWGDACELNGQFLGALEVYLEAVSMWPYLYSFWYRIAVNFSYVEKWWDESNTEKINLIFKLFNSCPPNENGDFWGELHPRRLSTPRNKEAKEWKDTEPAGEKKEPLAKTDFLERSRKLYCLLNKEIRVWRAISNWVYALVTGVLNFIFKPVEYTTGLSRYLWHYIPFFPWMDATQFRRMAELAFYITMIHLPKSLPGNDCPKIDFQGASLEAFVYNKTNTIVNKLWNRTAVYYNAACVYASLLSNTQNNAEGVVLKENAIKYIKKATRDQSPLEVEWAKTDPDLKALGGNDEFKALFDISDIEEQQSKEDKEKKDKHYMIELLRVGIVQQKNDWEKAHRKRIAAMGLIAEADYQIRLWSSLETLSGKPTDGELQETFWKLVMQKGKTEIMPDPSEMSQDDIKKLDLGKLDKCLKFVQGAAKSQREIWEKRKEDGKLFLKHVATPMTGVWSLWQQAEMAQWIYLEKKIAPILEDKPSKKKNSQKSLKVTGTSS